MRSRPTAPYLSTFFNLRAPFDIYLHDNLGTHLPSRCLAFEAASTSALVCGVFQAVTRAVLLERFAKRQKASSGLEPSPVQHRRLLYSTLESLTMAFTDGEAAANSAPQSMAPQDMSKAQNDAFQVTVDINNSIATSGLHSAPPALT